MTMPALSEVQMTHRFDQVFEQMAQQVRSAVPTLSYAVQHGHNDSFPWWAVARFAQGVDEGKVVDVSIDCHRLDHVLRVHADLAKESGLVLVEFAPVEVPFLADDGAIRSALDDVIIRIEHFLLQHVDVIYRELA